MDIQSLIAQHEVLQVLNRFVRSVDSRDYLTLKACLADEVEFDYSELGKEFPRSADRLIEDVREGHRLLDGLQHLTANHIIEVNGQTASSSCNYIATHFRKFPQLEAMWAVAGHYDYRLKRGSDGWKIAFCKIHVAWSAGDKTVFEPEIVGEQL